MKIKTSELAGAALDWAVAKCNAVPNVHIINKPDKICVYGEVAGVDFPYQPSTDWSQGGPIIERERLAVLPCADERGRYWAAGANGPNARWEGVTPLIAAMRCYVASKLGDEVDVPEELE